MRGWRAKTNNTVGILDKSHKGATQALKGGCAEVIGSAGLAEEVLFSMGVSQIAMGLTVAVVP